MRARLSAVHCEGIRVDCLGNYLAGLGLLTAISKRWPNARGCWRRGNFVLVGESINADAVTAFLLKEWRPTPYENWWGTAQKADTKAKSDRNIHRLRASEPDLGRVRLLDCHVVGSGRNQFNTIFGTGGNIGKRSLVKVYHDSLAMLREDGAPIEGWVRTTLFGEATEKLPDLGSAGTWFVYANKTFNSGQAWYREGRISPWSFLLALEGGRLLRGGSGRRLGSRARPYTIFPFLSGAPSPETEGEIKLIRGEFWAPLWEGPANCAELEALMERGLARIDDRSAQAPHEFALAARSAGVDSGVSSFVRFSLRQTTSSQVFEAIPGESVIVAAAGPSESALLLPLLDWMKYLPEPPSNTQKAKFRGLRGRVESALIRISERPNDPERWRALLLLLATVQDRLDHNRGFRERSRPVPRLHRDWFDKAWPTPPPEAEIARSLASIGAGSKKPPLFVNVVGATEDPWGNRRFPPSRPSQAVFHSGEPTRVLAGVLERRLTDTEPGNALPLDATIPCTPELIEGLLSGAVDWEGVLRWLPAMVLIDWSGSRPAIHPSRAASGDFALYGFFKPLFHPQEMPLKGQRSSRETSSVPNSLTARRLLWSIRSGDWAQAADTARNRYRAQGYHTIPLPAEVGADGDRVAAALLIPMRTRDVAAGFARWLEPERE